MYNVVKKKKLYLSFESNASKPYFHIMVNIYTGNIKCVGYVGA